MINLFDDLSTVTNIGKFNFDKLNNKSILLIAHAVDEAIRENKDLIDIDIGIGILTITNIKEELNYSFTPNTILHNNINKVLKGKGNPLIDAINQKIEVRLKSAYKELM